MKSKDLSKLVLKISMTLFAIGMFGLFFYGETELIGTLILGGAFSSAFALLGIITNK
tara:strand:+ start:2314 stop:2484 length:171 start_codon:yes stop_codon:yes gene_type:complete